jgi:hypothetical protein
VGIVLNYLESPLSQLMLRELSLIHETKEI